MKKILCIVALILGAAPAFAQLYLRGNIGYNLPANSQVIGTDYKQNYDTQSGVTSISQEAVYGSFGSGLSFHVGMGASLKGALGYDLELGYLIGKKNTTNYTYHAFDTVTTDNEARSSSFQIAPSLTFTAGTGNIQPYTRIGPVIGFTKITYKEFTTDTYNGIESKRETELSGGMSLGFKGVLGVVFNAESNVQFFAEANFVSMSSAPKDGKITSYSVNGDDAMDSLPKEQKSFELKDKVTNDDDPYTQVRQKYSMGSFGIQVGVKYVLK